MAYKYSKGWYVRKLRDAGIRKHPIYLRKLELYKTFIVRKLYFELVEKDSK